MKEIINVIIKVVKCLAKKIIKKLRRAKLEDIEFDEESPEGYKTMSLTKRKTKTTNVERKYEKKKKKRNVTQV